MYQNHFNSKLPEGREYIISKPDTFPGDIKDFL